MGFGAGTYRYEVLDGWGNFPVDLDVGDIVAVAVSNDRVYLFARGPNPVLVLNTEGAVLDCWGQGCFIRPHGLEITPAGLVLATDDGAHCVRCFDLDGTAVGLIGVPTEPAPFMSGMPFNRCTHTAMAPDGSVYVSDGYGNARVHKFSLTGDHILSWGEPGTGPGQFYIPHNICCDEQGWVFVADRENHRIQVFDGNGRYETEWRGVHRPCALCRGGHGPDALFYVGEVGPAMEATLGFPNLGPRLSILDAQGQVVARIGDPVAADAALLIAPHGIAVDHHGDIYVADLVAPAWPTLFPGQPISAKQPRLRKFRRIAGRADAR